MSDAEELAEHLADKAASDAADESAESRGEVGLVNLPAAGQAVRQRRREAPDPSAQLGNTLPNTLLTYYVPIPATKSWLLLNFSTPMDPLADQMVELFDVVAGTLHWD
ncbi:hypothetical protein [Streptomyces sp. NPDC048436]|uniref:hypothetical protein n=1 Tax=Streptomyces sp. NPDC048436 TaxID=3365550 RepID=UPI00371AEC69